MRNNSKFKIILLLWVQSIDVQQGEVKGVLYVMFTNSGEIFSSALARENIVIAIDVHMI